MAIYRLTYGSMTAHYGPQFIEAESEYEAKRKFAGTAFRLSEFICMTARPVSIREMQRELQRQNETD